MNIDLTNCRVLVTGASRGIGRAIAEAMAQAGAQVAVHYYREESALALAETLGGGAQAFRADLGDARATTRLFQEVVTTFGRIDVLVNNAGVAVSAPLAEEEARWLDEWRFTQRINLEAVALLCRRAVLHFAERPEGGRIINMASRAAFRGDTADYLAYAASKGGVVALTRSLARAYGKQNIKAFTLAPGFVRTDMAQDFMDQYGEAFALNDIALPRLTEPQDIAPLAVLLASGLADHATGSTFDLNAGSYIR
ncbi:NAD(P)-dependent dehydrogenase, short-chain alcohol dehydrogenase family [Catalinimonas alkaloidigena]|uniref:NAD(P)-dependent dehydrogenase, short-chain alcohol dehydrogenase family n=1 Tax=Catalinimonas alkaloidigena TaxID=1075417 RepID=A0A1G9Q3F5_9BACT|nr:SDR family oxidoreductase [Catalinimonas alkaloidigena]SDM04865.1 NAD(P)-dependent dehydrogenase, short-chain alcohol dehydrogenase family [Catalinimonas alkaloidigena]